MLFIRYRIAILMVEMCASISAQLTTASYLQSDPYTSDYTYPHSKYYYFFTPRSEARKLLQPSEPMIEDRGHDSYEGYQAHWPSKVIHQQPIHVHHTAPYHKEKNEHSYLLPILLLALLPLFIGGLLLLPLLFTFFTNILQLLALLQQTVQNINNQTNNVNNGGRRKRENKDLNPFLTTTIVSLVDKLIASQQKFKN